MDIIHAILLGIIEGFTEFLPISSTGHLILGSEVLGYYDSARIFTVVIQLGAIAAVIWHYRSDLFKKTQGLMRSEKSSIDFWKNLVVATLPAAVIGLMLNDRLDSFSTTGIIALALIIGGLIIILIESKRSSSRVVKKPEIEKLTFRQALLIGLYQTIAIIPGVSRSGATIMGGLLSGLDRVTATAFSFYLSIPIIVIAGLYKLIDGWDNLSSVSGGLPALVVGTVVSFITALVAINWLLKYVSTHDFKIFAYYRILLGLFILVVLAFR